MLKVVIRHTTWENGVLVGEFLPSEVESTVELIKNHGAFSLENNEKLEDYSYLSSRYDIDNNCFEIIIE